MTRASPHPIRWGLIFAVWTGYGLLGAAQEHLSYAMSRGTPLPWGTALLMQMPLAYTWALATPVILWLGRRFPFERGRWPSSIAIHLAICLTFVFLLDLAYAFHISNVLPQPPNPKPVFTRAVQFFVVWVLSDGLLYWTILSVSYAVEHHRRFRERELTASQLETQLVQADLQALKMQLHPHFLFNALHTIGSLVRTGDRDTAVRVVAGLGDLLRRVLDGAAQQEVPLKQELEFIRNYLDIEQVRFRDRLKVAINADPDVLDAKVPHLILQPLVENAIRHGIAPHLSAGYLMVGARRVDDQLQLVVRDDGPGIGNGDSEGGVTTARPGIGLSNTRARLTRLYGADCELEVGNAPDGGLEARIVLPFRLAHAEWQGET
ncbi:MAG TPA: histidine kinase [Gemmatimonadales bacterium]|nr:histidine kinase [Gemmatimonadales bacterium]